MMQLVHGGDWAGYRAQYGQDALDFSANVSPLGLPEGVAKAITAALATADRYPDPLCRALRAKLAVHETVPAEHILCGNGAADLIFRLVWAAKPRTALLPAPTFAEYAAALETAGCTVRRHFLREIEDFAVTEAFISAVDEDTDMVFLCQPNNPTGQLTPLALVEALLHRCEACGALLVVDECFLDFLPQSEVLSAKKLLASPNLIILKAFTKLYGMAGVRLGYCLCSNTALLEKMRAAVGSFQPCTGGGAGGAGRDRLCSPGARIDCRAASCFAGRAARTGAAGAGWKCELSAVPSAGNTGRCPAAARHRAAQLRQLPRTGRQLVPHRRAHRAGKPAAFKNLTGGACMSRAKCIMVQGTMSGAGKSLLCTALCRIFAQDGYRVAPFKSQNMALNSFVTRDGLEMGRAQVVQAQAAGMEPDVRMNPILLKPSSDVGSQVIVNGEVRGQMPAAAYFKLKKSLIPDILAAYDSLAEEVDIIVIEGAGSPAEINLKADDIVNMGLAELVDAPVLLAGDIDRGGVFAQLYGTVELLEPAERARIKGLIINKFRGDAAILKPGLTMLEEKTHLPVLGVVPYLRVDIEDEDSLSSRLESSTAVKPLDAAILRLPHISNFTDFMPLEQHPLLSVRYVQSPRQLGAPDVVILPGTKNTIDDLLWLRQCGLEATVQKLATSGTPVLGVCGGYQMLGETLADPEGTESGRSQTVRGLGLLPIQTVFTDAKHRTQDTATVTAPQLAGAVLTGYQIHTGRTAVQGVPFCRLADGSAEGCVKDNVAGTYLHGLFDTGELTEKLVQLLCSRKDISPASAPLLSMAEYRQQQFDLLADGVRRALDMNALYAAMGLEGRNTV